MRADRLEYLYQQDQQDYRNDHDKVFIAVVAIVDGDFAKAAAADDAAHRGITEDGGDGNGGV